MNLYSQLSYLLHDCLSEVPYSGTFSLSRNVLWVLIIIFAFLCQETTPTNNFVCEIPLRGSLIIACSYNFRIFCLPSKNAKFCTSRKFPAVRYMIVKVKYSGTSINDHLRRATTRYNYNGQELRSGLKWLQCKATSLGSGHLSYKLWKGCRDKQQLGFHDCAK